MDLLTSHAIDQVNIKFQSLREHPDQNILTDLGIVIIIIILSNIILILLLLLLFSKICRN